MTAIQIQEKSKEMKESEAKTVARWLTEKLSYDQFARFTVQSKMFSFLRRDVELKVRIDTSLQTVGFVEDMGGSTMDDGWVTGPGHIVALVKSTNAEITVEVGLDHFNDQVRAILSERRDAGDLAKIDEEKVEEYFSKFKLTLARRN